MSGTGLMQQPYNPLLSALGVTKQHYIVTQEEAKRSVVIELPTVVNHRKTEEL